MTGRPPMVDRRGYPTAEHPESLAAELPEAEETELARLAAGLWPDDEYAAIVAEHDRRIGWQQ